MQAVASGLSPTEIQRATGVSPNSISRWKRKQAAGASLEPGRAPGPRHKVSHDDEPALREQVAAHPDATLAEHCAMWSQTHGVLSVPTMSRTLARLGLPLKKKTLIATEQDAGARAEWREELAALAPESLVFLDETSTQTVMTRHQGRAPRGQRVVGHVPRHHGPNVTCPAAVTPTGMRVPCVVGGAVDGPLFVRWIREWLVPTLAPGTTVVLDTLSVHKNPDVRTAIEGAGCHLRFLSAYSPDFNPIELVFAHLKTHLRATGTRTFEALVKAIGAGLDQVSAADIRGYYRHCGYPLPAVSDYQHP